MASKAGTYRVKNFFGFQWIRIFGIEEVVTAAVSSAISAGAKLVKTIEKADYDRNPKVFVGNVPVLLTRTGPWTTEVMVGPFASVEDAAAFRQKMI